MEVTWDSTELSFVGVDFSPWVSNHPTGTVDTGYTKVNGGNVTLHLANFDSTLFNPAEVVVNLWLKVGCFGATSTVSFDGRCPNNFIINTSQLLLGPQIINGQVTNNSLAHTLTLLGDSSLAVYPDSIPEDTAKVAVRFTCGVQTDSFISNFQYPRDSLDAIAVVRDASSGLIANNPHFSEDRSGSTAKLRITYSGQIDSTSTAKTIYWIYFKNIMDANYAKATVLRKPDSLRICDGHNSDLYSYISTSDSATVTTYYKAGMRFKRTEAYQSTQNVYFPVQLSNNFWVKLKGQDTVTTFRIDQIAWDANIVDYSSFEAYFDNKWRWYDMGGTGNKRFSNHQNSQYNIDTSSIIRNVFNSIVDAGSTVDSQVTHLLEDGTKLKDLYSDITITKAAGITLDSAYFVVKESPPPPPGCPFLYVWNGSEFEQDNTILAASEITPGTPATDYYMLSKPLVPFGDEYRLQIREFENEVSYIDRVKLVAVDHTPDIKIGVTPEGKIFGYDKSLYPVACVDQYGRDHLAEISDKDGVYFASYEPGYLVITYSKKASLQNVLYDPPPEDPNSTQPPPPGEKKAGIVSVLTVEVQDLNGNWHKLADIPPRFYPYRTAWFVDDGNVNLGDEFKMKVSWDHYYSVDQLKYFIQSEEKPLQIWSGPLAANNTGRGDALKELFDIDQEYTTLASGQNIDLSFPVYPPSQPDMVRDFVLQTVGYYISLAKPKVIPTSFALLNNYPNPFNPNTTILYALPHETDVKLEVYNILGQRVRVLVNEHQAAGYKTIVWDGRNDKGEAVSTGIYFYRLQAENYINSKKMILMK
ncbi:MAG TPA: T9SS type A sorting domain-containing protein [Terriglobales bacterium]|nr:T9SS type A sorting domain-containing protein [Terriglobales bacterium]